MSKHLTIYLKYLFNLHGIRKLECLHAKKTEDLLETDLVVPYGKSGSTANITKVDDLDIKKLDDGSFDIKTGIDKINGTNNH